MCVNNQGLLKILVSLGVGSHSIHIQFVQLAEPLFIISLPVPILAAAAFWMLIPCTSKRRWAGQIFGSLRRIR